MSSESITLPLKLAQVNACQQDIHIKDINSYDEEDFYNCLNLSSKDKRCFENHWCYIIQSTRMRGKVLKLSTTRIYFYEKTQVNQRILVVVNYFGEVLLKAMRRLQHHARGLGLSIIIKNVVTDDVKFWQSLGFCERKERWSPFSYRDDNSYPELFYNLKTIALAHHRVPAGEKRQSRASHANRIRKFISSRNIIIREYNKSTDRDCVEKLLYSNAEFLEDKAVDSAQNIIDAHWFVFDNSIKYKKRLIHQEGEKIIGFNYITIIKNVLYGDAIIHINESDLMRFLVWQGFHYLYKQLDTSSSYSVTLQGSENIGQSHWKRGFAPINQVFKTHLEWHAD